MTETKISRKMMASIDEAFADVLKSVLQRHKGTLRRIDKLVQDGDADRASRLWRRSGLLDDLAKAIAGAGAVSADAIRDGLDHLRKAVRDEAV